MTYNVFGGTLNLAQSINAMSVLCTVSDILWCIFARNIYRTVLWLCRNNVDDIVQVEFLALCQNLTRLTFDGNPICVAANPSAADVSCSVIFCYQNVEELFAED